MKNDDPLEKKIEEDSRLHARDLGWDSRKMNGLGNASWPDRLFIPPPRAELRGWTAFWVEFKRKGKKPTPDQARKIKDLRKRHQRVYVCDSFALFKRIMKGEHGG